VAKGTAEFSSQLSSRNTSSQECRLHRYRLLLTSLNATHHSRKGNGLMLHSSLEQIREVLSIFCPWLRILQRFESNALPVATKYECSLVVRYF
jgi:hypothetical protein